MKTMMLRTITLSFLLVIFILGCSKEAVTTTSTEFGEQSKPALPQNIAAAKQTKVYTIEEGNHYANGKHFPLYRGKGVSFTAIFDSSAIYNFTDVRTKYDQNTLYGFADNGQDHRNFSARFGWRWFNNELQIAAYTFNFSDSTILEIGSVPLNAPSTYAIAVKGDHYDFTLNGRTTSLPRASTTSTAGYYKLLPYFGGDAVAPQTVTIQIQEN